MFPKSKTLVQQAIQDLDALTLHLLKRQYVSLPDCYRGWLLTIKRTQSELKDMLKESPSLRNLLIALYLECYQEAVENMRIEYDVIFPDDCPFSDNIDELLNSKFKNIMSNSKNSQLTL